MTPLEPLFLDVACQPDQNNVYELQLFAAPITSQVPWNEASSDLYELTWTILDRESRAVLDTIRQSDRRLVLHHIRVGKHHCMGRDKLALELQPSMPWLATEHPVTRIGAPTTDNLPSEKYTIDLQMGAPADLPFFGRNWSYGEGSDAHGNWFHCKRFRWTNNNFDFVLPLTPGSKQTARINLFTPVSFAVQTEDGKRHRFPPMEGGRWRQPFCDVPVSGGGASVIGGSGARLRICAVGALPGLQADLRELFAAVESLETDVYVDEVSQIPIGPVLDAAYAGGEAPSDDARVRLLHHLGRLGYPRSPALLGEPRADVLIFVDPVYDEFASRRLETGAVWMNSIQGAALACRELGLVARIGGVELAKVVKPQLVIIPHQNLRSSGTDAILGYAAENGIPVLQESNFHPETLAHWRMLEFGQYILRGDWRFEDGTDIPELWKTFVQHFGDDSHHTLLVRSVEPNLPICVRHRNHRNEYMLTGFFFFNFFNYGIHTHIRVLEKLLFEGIKIKPRIRVAPTSPVTFMAAASEERITLRILGGGAGLFPYHGLARAFSIAPTRERTDIGRVDVTIADANGKRIGVSLSDCAEAVLGQAGDSVTLVAKERDTIELTFPDPYAVRP